MKPYSKFIKTFWSVFILSTSISVSATEKPALISLIKNHLGIAASGNIPRHRVAYADLNNDGILDAIVLVEGNEYCGSGGCTLLVFSGEKENFKFISKSTVTKPPIRVLNNYSNGWKYLVVNSGGVGAVLLNFNGKSYSSNPSLAKKASTEEVASSVTFIAPSSLLVTKNFAIWISSGCQEGEKVCNSVMYFGQNLANQQSIQLTGEKKYSSCPESTTLCPVNGYSFKNGKIEYYVSVDGELKVTEGNAKVLLIEKGEWRN